MALTSEERIEFSKKIVSIPSENEKADEVKDMLGADKQKLEDKDSGHKKLAEQDHPLINGYQSEIQKLDGNERTQLTEQDYEDSALKVINNPFFPNDGNTPTPSLPNGVWTQFIPFAYTKAIGKKFDETHDIIDKEQDKIDAINTEIATMESYTAIGRSTGQFCTPGDPGPPPLPDVIANDPAIQATAIAMVSAVNDWKTFLNTMKSAVVTFDTDPTRAAENQAAIDDIDAAIVIIDDWLALPNFDTNHGQTTCAGFNSYNVNLLNPTKFRAAELQLLKDEIAARVAFGGTRLGQLSGYLGSITQDLNSGDVTAKDGFYGTRWGFIDLRLNLISGSLTQLKGMEQAQNAQDELKKSNDNAAATYDGVMKAVLFNAPAAGTGTIHVKDASAFAPGDTVYIVADEMAEISTTISSIDGNTVYLAGNVDKKYTPEAFARLYKEL